MQCTMLDYYTPRDLEIKIKLETEDMLIMCNKHGSK